MRSARESKQQQHQDRLSRRKFRMGDVDVQPRSGRISGPEGERKLDPKVMDVLVCLASNDGRVVTRDALMEDVWSGVIVTDFALSRILLIDAVENVAIG